LLESDLERERQIVRLNVEAVQQLTGAFLHDMVDRGTGAILNVASTAAFQPLPGFASYAASKAFVQSFSEAVHTELTGTGVSVTCLFPGFTRTEFVENPGAEGAESTIPGFLWMEAPDVARVGIDAMLAGHRTAIPGMKNRALMLSGRMTPRTVLLPLVRQVTRRR
jgi:short-subunit dehydrogenase